MRRQRLGCISPLGFVAALITVVVISVSVAAQGGSLFSPGGLNAIEGPALGGVVSHASIGGKCAACHTAPWEETSMAEQCLVCHNQIEADLSRPDSLHGAMVSSSSEANCLNCHTEHHGSLAMLTRVDIKNFPHEVTGFMLTSHVENLDGSAFECKDCHGTDYRRMDNTVCESCHRDSDPQYLEEHTAAFGSDCTACHDGIDRFGASFDHSHTQFPLTGGHTSLECAACHLGHTSPTALAAAPQDCITCHQEDDAHSSILGTGCSECHTSEGWTPANFDHAEQTGFKLVGAHLAAECTACHVSKDLKSTPQQCAACHKKDDAHKGNLGPDCAACHTSSAWQPASFDHSTRTAFKLEGKHIGVTCTSCHTTPDVKNTPQQCAACHKADDPHQGRLGQDCAACHTAAEWSPSTFDHSRSAFKLVGRHEQTPCAGCHKDTTFKGTPVQCAACHRADDAHAGSLGTECSLCHTAAAWKPSTFNHANATFSLTGAHVAAACTACHKDASFSGTPTTCAVCHANDDQHNGQLGSDCAACHTTDRWSNVIFNHATSGFPLTGAHSDAACSSCHKNGAFRNTPTTCAACHAADDRHNGQFGSDCAACHTTDRWSNVTFNHANSAFPLTGAHVGLPCSRCHSSGFSGTPTECSACHTEPSIHAGLFMANCAACHSTSAWIPASFSGPHTFPMGHGGANTCRDCHTGSFGTFTCFGCHNQGEIVKEHDDEDISNLNNCVACHADGRKGDDGDGGDGGEDDDD